MYKRYIFFSRSLFFFALFLLAQWKLRSELIQDVASLTDFQPSPQVFCCHCCSFAQSIFISAKLLLCVSFHPRGAKMAKGKRPSLTLATPTQISGLLLENIPECARRCIQPLVLRWFLMKRFLNSPQVSHHLTKFWWGSDGSRTPPEPKRALW